MKTTFTALQILLPLVTRTAAAEVRVYKETSSFQRDILFTVDVYLTVEEFFAVWHAVRYVY